MKKFLTDFLDMRPKDEKDYCTFLAWQISKKPAMILMAAVTLCCVCILWCVRPAGLWGGAYRTYRHDALSLRFATGKARILGDSGYTAYIGDVDHGVVKGRGTLYDLQGNVVYEGEFDANAYNGEGTRYYRNGLPMYEGGFQDNQYKGEGKLYRENGTLWYEGTFRQGQMEGGGTLYGAAQKELYRGSFQGGQILYQELIGKSAAQITEMYLGEREVYTGDNLYCVSLKEIGAVYFGADRNSALDEGFRVSGLYVLKPEISLEGKLSGQIPQVSEILGPPLYEGNTYLEPEDEVALNLCCEAAEGEVLYGEAGYRSSSLFDDVTEIWDFAGDYQAYIHVYEKDGIVYTFFCKDRDSGFDFYRMEE